MKKIPYLLVIILALTAMLISACGGGAAVSAPNPSGVGGGGKPQAMPVEFTGAIESMNGNQWTVNGQSITVDPAVVRDGPFNVGDTIKVEVNVQADGSMVVSRVESPVSVAVVPSLPPDASATPENFPSPSSTPQPVSVISATPVPVLSATPVVSFGNQSSGAISTATSVNGSSSNSGSGGDDNHDNNDSSEGDS